jgi:hypothetical protein
MPEYVYKHRVPVTFTARSVMKKTVFYLTPLLFLNCYLNPAQPTPEKTSRVTLSEKDFLQNKMFFLDTMYLNYFLNNHAQVPDAKKVKESSLEVWLHTDQTEAEMKWNGRKDKFCYLKNKNGAVFKLLTEGRDYKLSGIYEGCIRFDSVAIFENDIIGICMTTRDGASIVKGDTGKAFLHDTATTYKSNLWILKGQDPVETDSNFSLMCRNVYAMPGDFDVSKFKIQVRRVPEAGDTTMFNEDHALYSMILGLTDFNGNANIGTTSIFDMDNNLLIIPPFSDGKVLNNKPFANPALGKENMNPDIYRLTAENFSELNHKYAITMIWPAP